MKRFISPVCYELLMIPVGLAYLMNSANFGKAIVGWWGIVAIALSVLLLAAQMIRKEQIRRRVVRCGNAFFALMQLPPLVCWLMLGDPGFHMYSVFVTGIAGIVCHALLAAWALVNVAALGKDKNAAA